MSPYPTITGHDKLYPFTDVQAAPYNCDPTGTADCAPAIESLKSYQASVGTIFFPPGTYKIATNLTIPAGMTIKLSQGAVLAIQTGITLTIAGWLDAGPYQIFSPVGTGTISFGGLITQIYPEWWGGLSAIGSTNCTISLGGTWSITSDQTIPANVTLKVIHGGIINIATNKTLTINGTIEAGLYQIFSLTGTGAVAGLKESYPEWFGAAGDGATDDTSALTAAATSITAGGIISLAPKTYATTGWLITKTLSLVTDAPPSSLIGTTYCALKAVGSQAYVVKFQGAHTSGSAGYLRPYIRNIAIDGNSGGSAVISDAALIMETCFNPRADNFTVQDVTGHGVRLRNIYEGRYSNFFILNCGTINTGSAWYIDGPTPFDADYLCNNVSILGGTWSANRGRWIDVNSMAGMDGFWIQNNKFESDSTLGIPNTAPTDVIHIGAAGRTQIIHNTFANFGVTEDNYANLIYINGDPGGGSSGGSDNLVMGNQAANIAGNGAINGLYLDTNCPTVVEKDNVFRTSEAARTALSNVNVSVYPQMIGKYWRTVSGSIFLIVMPSIEWPGFVSAHKLSRSTSTAPFVADANCVNDAGTVLKLTAANQSLPEICALQDLTRWVGHNAINLLIRVRMRLDAAGSVTVNGVPNSPGYAPVPIIVNSTAWTWYEFLCPIANLSSTNHFLNIFYWAINTGTPNLLVDGIEFLTSDTLSETVTTGSPALKVGGYSNLNSVGGAITATLADGVFIGQIKTIVMTDATTSSTVSVAHHVTSDPEVFTFAVLGAYLTLQWNGTKWATIHNYGVTT